MRILITGASGLLGGRIFEYLKKNKMEIIIASRTKKKLKNYKFKYTIKGRKYGYSYND